MTDTSRSKQIVQFQSLEEPQRQTNPIMTRSRSTSFPRKVKEDENADESKRNHSSSITSVGSDMSDIEDLQKLMSDDAKRKGSISRQKIMLMDDVDLEKQMIIAAGGKRST